MTVITAPNVDTNRMGLPKWPQMIVRGQPVTVDQAKEIIRRTDSAFVHSLSGNDHETIKTIAQKLALPSAMWFDQDNRRDWSVQDFHKTWEDAQHYRDVWGVISTEYVRNEWVSSAFIFGPNGWCHPDGTIAFDHNVGKYPSVEAVANDWDLLVTAFPFLDLTATLMSGEGCEDDIRPVATIRVKDGVVTICNPETPPEVIRPDFSKAIQIINSEDLGREMGIPMAWIDEWGAMQWEKIRALQ